MSKDKSKMMPAQRRWLQDDHQFHGKLSPMFDLRELPGWHEEAQELYVNQSLTEAIAQVLDVVERVLEQNEPLTDSTE